MMTRTTKLENLLRQHSQRQGARRARRHRLFFRCIALLGQFMNRLVELIVAVPVSLFAALPVYWILVVRKLVRKNSIFVDHRVRGQGGEIIGIRRFNIPGSSLLQNLSLFSYVISGRLALVGPEIRDAEDISRGQRDAYISTLKPGIFSLTYVRRSSKIAHEGEEAIAWEYVFKKSLLFDVLLLLRTLPAIFFQSADVDADDTLELFGLKIANMTMGDAIVDLEESIMRHEHRAIYFVNADCLNKIFQDTDYFHILQRADRILPDGIGLVLAGNMLRTPLKENVNGTDMLPFLCEMAASRGFSLFLLGGQPQVAEEMAVRLTQLYKVKIAGIHHGYFDREHENEKVVATINSSGAEILLVAFGAPLQEKWINENKECLKAHILMGVGGLFDFYSKRTRRAPRWLREIGLEWVFRILQEPGRMWRRYVIGNPLFLYRVMRWKLYPWQAEMTHSTASSERKSSDER